ncbi:DUF4231 domain-containing protein [Actinoallomurus rhizosphaericola]|uniref:DUF4231 domain-containing protein n=1 Tax=Actinoallomurus rhizosphaericola TaxID=2952536 RepID=UPI002092F4BD|nr:DUF4231 domain-containing protein [Actinoallomurus rhizosphaericola]MCO5996120.1 DUF4231 domain-containing protein [Actinoallomurus rhizosphaericola]
MVDVTARETRLLRQGRVYIGWRYAQVHGDPGPPPKRPTPPEAEEVDAESLAAHRREAQLFNRPLRIVAGATGVGAALFVTAGLTGALLWAFAAAGLVACAFVALITGYAIWQSEKFLRARAAAEMERFERRQEDRRRRLEAAHAEHARAYRDWQKRREAFESQHEWYAVTLPAGLDRVDVAGGTLSGWSATVTMMGAARLAAGSQVTVLDLSEGAVARELIELGNDQGERPQVWVLPGDLPQLDLTHGLEADQLADVLSLVVSVSEEQGSARDLSFDNAILERVLGVFGGRASIPRITAALRALAQVGDPRDDLRAGLLTDEELAKITTMFGRGAADRVVIERAWALESQLRKLDKLGSSPTLLPPSRLRVIATDRRAGVLTNRVLGTYVTAALTHVLRGSPQGKPWEHTLLVCGAEKLRGDVLDRLIDACEATSTGLVLMYRSLPAHVKERLGRGHAAVGFMRLGNAEDARVAAEHIGVEHTLEVAELTEKVGDTVGIQDDGAYVSTVGPAAPLPVFNGHEPTDAALPDGIGRATSWGQGTSLAAEAGKGSREFAVEPRELQQLAPTAMIFTHADSSGRRILLVDANPGIMTLPTANIQEFEEATDPSRARHAKPDLPQDAPRPTPNLGPPPERLDFRKKKR